MVNRGCGEEETCADAERHVWRRAGTQQAGEWIRRDARRALAFVCSTHPQRCCAVSSTFTATIRFHLFGRSPSRFLRIHAPGLWLNSVVERCHMSNIKCGCIPKAPNSLINTEFVVFSSVFLERGIEMLVVLPCVIRDLTRS